MVNKPEEKKSSVTKTVRIKIEQDNTKNVKKILKQLEEGKSNAAETLILLRHAVIYLLRNEVSLLDLIESDALAMDEMNKEAKELKKNDKEREVPLRNSRGRFVGKGEVSK